MTNYKINIIIDKSLKSTISLYIIKAPYLPIISQVSLALIPGKSNYIDNKYRYHSYKCIAIIIHKHVLSTCQCMKIFFNLEKIQNKRMYRKKVESYNLNLVIRFEKQTCIREWYDITIQGNNNKEFRIVKIYNAHANRIIKTRKRISTYFKI